MTIREQIEQDEKLVLSPLATCAADSQGRAVYEAEDPFRTAFMRDRDRIIHSKAFRRLKRKTQVYVSPENDHYRTRLTHTLEVAQIANTISRGLKLNVDLIEAIALAHDVGHTPFAHCGEEVLDKRMPQGFKHNLNSVRVLSEIEEHGKKRGLNLSKEVLNGIAHHSGLEEKDDHAFTLEGQVIRYADKIAYVQHDIDDSIRAGLLKEEEIPTEYTDVLGQNLSDRITTLVGDLIEQGQQLTDKRERLIFSPEVGVALKGLRQFLFDRIYHGETCIKERERASFIVDFLFDHFLKHPHKMPLFYQKIVDEKGLEQGVCDYISGMTDNYCVYLFEEFTIPRSFISSNR